VRLLRAVTLACGIALAGASAAAPVATAPDDPAADRVIAAIATRAAPIKAYTFNLNVRVALLTFPWIRFTLVGHGEYERNGSFLIHFDHVPWFGKGYSTIKMDALDPSNWSKHYVITLAGQDGTVSHLSMRDRSRARFKRRPRRSTRRRACATYRGCGITAGASWFTSRRSSSRGIPFRSSKMPTSRCRSTRDGSRGILRLQRDRRSLADAADRREVSAISTRKSVGTWSLLNALWVPLTAQDAALMTIAVPAALLHIAPTSYRSSLSILVSVAAVGAMVVPPLAGWFSDRSRRAGGSRRAFVVAGVVIDVAALAAIAFVHNIWLFGALLIAAIAGANVAIAAYQAMLPRASPANIGESFREFAARSR